MADSERTEAADRARAVWSAGDFDAIAQRIKAVGEDTVARVGIGEADRVLDVGCGSGNTTIPAALVGAEVTGLDITPKLLDDGRRNAADAGVEIEWVEGDAQELPFAEQSFDVVVSTFGCMFAPDHGAAAAEIARVLRPGGRIGLAAWTPAGRIGGFFMTLAAHAPPPPEGFQPPPLWGVSDHVRGLFADTGVEPRFEEATARFRFDSQEEAVREYETKFGPVVTLRAALEPEGRWGAAHDALVDYFGEVNTATDDGYEFEAEYLLTLGGKPA